MSYMPPSKLQQHLTPDRVFDIMEKEFSHPRESYFDPCPKDTPYKSPCFFNGLYGDWTPLNYVNCPFKKEILERFVQKALDQYLNNQFTTVMLLPTKTDQDWYHDIILKYGFKIVWIRKRLKFKGNKHHATDTHFLTYIGNFQL